MQIKCEVTPEGDLFHIGAELNGKVFGEDRIQNPSAALKRLSDFAGNARYILGHNILAHDLLIAGKLFPEAGILSLIPLDTLYLFWPLGNGRIVFRHCPPYP